MPRDETRPRSRREVAILVKQLLEHAGERGMSTRELLDALGPSVSLRTLQRALADLRSEHGADLTCSGKPSRWYLRSRLLLPLDAPDRDDVVTALLLRAHAELALSPDQRDRTTKIVEGVDARARDRVAPSDLPLPNVLTSSFTLGTRADLQFVARLLLACRRRVMRMRYESPWQGTGPASRDIEPWAMHVHDGAYYLRAWARDTGKPSNFNVAHIQTLEDVDDATPRQPIPAKPWGRGGRAFGIDNDRPGLAVIRFRGAIARWVAGTRWHDGQGDKWIDGCDELERTVAYQSRRELVRRLAWLVDGIVSISPPELLAEVQAHCACAAKITEGEVTSTTDVNIGHRGGSTSATDVEHRSES